MLVIIVHRAMPVKEIDDKNRALIFLVILFLLDFIFHFGSVFKIRNLE
jgi:hypothetical protein